MLTAFWLGSMEVFARDRAAAKAELAADSAPLAPVYAICAASTALFASLHEIAKDELIGISETDMLTTKTLTRRKFFFIIDYL